MTLDDIIKVIENTKVVPNFSEFNPDAPLADNGVDSLDTYTIILALEEEFAVGLDDVEIEEIDSAAKIYNYIKSHS